MQLKRRRRRQLRPVDLSGIQAAWFECRVCGATFWEMAADGGKLIAPEVGCMECGGPVLRLARPEPE
jgi:hypothetical protein